MSQYEKCIRHDCDTLPGNSGSPIFNSENQVIAIHNAGNEFSNRGVLLSREIMGTLSYMCATYH